MPVSIGALASDGTSYIRDIFRDIEYSEVNTYSEKTYSKIFGGHQEFNDDSVTLKDLAWKCRGIYEEYPYHFDTLRKCYWEACSWWKLFGVKDTKQSKNRPKDGKIHWMQLEKAVHK